MSLFKDLMAAKFAAKKAAPAVRARPAPRPKPAPARVAVPTPAPVPLPTPPPAPEPSPPSVEQVRPVVTPPPAPVPSLVPEKAPQVVPHVTWEFPVAPTPPPPPPRPPSIVVANGKVIARGSCKAINADTGRQCALLAGHLPAEVHQHGNTRFVRVAGEGQTSFTRRDVLDSAATRGNGITNTGA